MTTIRLTALSFGHIIKLKCFARNRLTVFRKFIECATHHLDVLRKLVFCLYKFKIEDRLPADFLSALQFVKKGFSEFPITSQEKFTERLKTLTGFNIKCNVKIYCSNSHLLNVLNNQVPEVQEFTFQEFNSLLPPGTLEP
jgi:hypothetical protein